MEDLDPNAEFYLANKVTSWGHTTITVKDRADTMTITVGPAYCKATVPNLSSGAIFARLPGTQIVISPINGKFIPIDGTTIVYDASFNELSAAPQVKCLGNEVKNISAANGISVTNDIDWSIGGNNLKISAKVDGTTITLNSDNQLQGFSGNYNDLSNKPTIPAAQVQADYAQSNSSAVDYIKNKPNLATVATTGDYGDLLNKPTIPAAQVNSDWNAASGVAQILNKPDLSHYVTDNTAQTITGEKTLDFSYSYINPQDNINKLTTFKLEKQVTQGLHDDKYAITSRDYTVDNGITRNRSATIIPGIIRLEDDLGSTFSNLSITTSFLSYDNKIIHYPSSAGTLALTSDILGSSTET